MQNRPTQVYIPGIAGYTILEKLYESERSQVHRAIRVRDDLSVILKILKTDNAEPERLIRFRHEFELTRGFNSEYVIKALGLEKLTTTLVMVLEDIGGYSLDRILSGQRLDTVNFLRLAAKIAHALGDIHGGNVIHRDINPTNIIWNQKDDIVKIIDFGISSELSLENPRILPPGFLEGTLSYISPEQTGRMNRNVDYRTDYYSLGVTLYEILLGLTPFQSDDELEIIHSHIAREVVSPYEYNRQIPEMVSRIIMKLLSKTAENRYHSARGLITDLSRCLEELQTGGSIELFKPGLGDFSSRFQIPQKLYGRESEIRILEEANERTDSGLLEFTMVTGYSGIGKSSLVREAQILVGQNNAFLGQGKFDQFKRNLPYYSLSQAFQDIIRQILTGDDAQILEWKQKILGGLGSAVRLLMDIIPDLELIVGTQPKPSELPPNEARNRFQRAFENFVRLFATPEHPLTLFLDDLQWADSSSLKMLVKFAEDKSGKNLHIIGAYRSNEVGPGHALRIALDEIKKSGGRVNEITLGPLSIENIMELIADTLKCDYRLTQELANICRNKTDGNPFFLGQFLENLNREGLVTLDLSQGKWTWDIDKILSREVTDNVVELMAGKIKQLSPPAQQALRIASCIGASFDIQTLAVVNQKSRVITSQEIKEALLMGLIQPLDAHYNLAEYSEDTNVTYRFLHDRVQQAAYHLIPEENKRSIHLRVGRLLLKNLAEDEIDEKLFAITGQLNEGVKLIREPAEKLELARLNLLAGQRAKFAAAFGPAFDYISVGISLLEETSWKVNYEQALALHVEGAEAAYLNGNFDRMDQLISTVLLRAGSAVDKARAYEVRLQAFIARDRFGDAIDTGNYVLGLLGVELPRKPGQVHIISGMLKTRWTLRSHKTEDIPELRQMKDPALLAAMRILTKLVTPAYIALPELFPLIVFQLVNLSVKHGNTVGSAYGYATYGLILCGVVGDIETGYKFGQVSSRLLETINSGELKARTSYIINMMIRHWKEPLRDSLPGLLESYQAGLDTGDQEFAAYAATNYCYMMFLCGKELKDVLKEMSRYDSVIAGMGQEATWRRHRSYHQTVLNLAFETESEAPFFLKGEVYNEVETEPLYRETRDGASLFILYFNKVILAYLFGDFEEAKKNSDLAEEYLSGMIGTIMIPILRFYDSLTRIKLYEAAAPGASRGNRRRYLKKIRSNQKGMKKWAKYAPENFLHRYHLVEAELARVRGLTGQASENFELALRLSRESEYLGDEALANELAARFWLQAGKTDFAELYLSRAHYQYLIWGAQNKARTLKKEFGNILFFSNTRDNYRTSRTLSERNENLDISTVLKASRAISGEIRLDNFLKQMVRIVIENAGAQKGALLQEYDGELWVEAEGHVDPNHLSIVLNRRKASSGGLSLPVIQYVAHSRQEVVLNDAQKDSRFGGDSHLERNDVKSILCTPIIYQGKLKAILYLENNLISGAFTPERLEVINLLSSQTAVSFENAMLYADMEKKVRERTATIAKQKSELDEQILLAQKIQESLLPARLPSIRGASIAYRYAPIMGVGGDFLDIYYDEENDHLGFFICDVSGHGVPAAFLASMVKMTLHSWKETLTRPALTLTNIQNSLEGKMATLFITACTGYIDLKTGAITSASAGHIPYLLVRNNGEIEAIKSPGRIILESYNFWTPNFEDYHNKLEQGEKFILFTDGIIESSDDKNKLMGETGLRDIMVRYQGQNPQTICDGIYEDTILYSGKKESLEDDFTLFVLEYTGM